MGDVARLGTTLNFRAMQKKEDVQLSLVNNEDMTPFSRPILSPVGVNGIYLIFM